MDQRRSLRISVNLPARFRSAALSVDGRAADLSQSGMRFVGPPTDVAHVAPIRIEVEIDLPDAETPLSAAGEVRWIDGQDQPGSLGIRFTGLAIASRRRLANLILRACAAM